MSDEQWHKVRTKIYYAEYRRGKVGDVVECWFGTHRLREGDIVIRYPNGKVTVGSERDFLREHEEVS